VARIRHLKKAPITEAIVDFRVILPEAFRPDRLRDAAERLKEDYPKVEERKSAETVLELAKGRPTIAQMKDLGFTGVWLKSRDERSIGQFRVDGFTFNRLKPYTSWEEILPEALRLWDEYSRLASPEVVTRIALRYITHLTLPAGPADLDKLITTGPRLPDHIPQVLSSFSTRVVVQDPERGVSANITQALEVGVQTHSPTLLLDIDAYRIGQFRPEREVLVGHLSQLRSFKNAILFGTLTEEFIEGFEWPQSHYP